MKLKLLFLIGTMGDINAWKNNLEHTEARNLGRVKNCNKNTNFVFVKCKENMDL
jgi:hypothetical protein